MGPNHPSLPFTLCVCRDIYIEKGDYTRCLEIWEHSPTTDKASCLAYELQIKEDVLFTTRGFYTMLSNSFIPDVKPMVQWSFRELQNAKNNKLSETELVSAIMYLLSTWFKAIKLIKDPVKRENQLNQFDKAIVQLIEIGSNLKDPTPLLIMCLTNFEEKDSEVKINREIYKLDLPMDTVIHSLIANGCALTETDDEHNFPLHHAVQMKSSCAVLVVKVLIENGAPLYACKYDGKTALNICDDASRCPNISLDKMELFYRNHFTLQELCARMIMNGRIDYQQMPKSLQEFISWH